MKLTKKLTGCKLEIKDTALEQLGANQMVHCAEIYPLGILMPIKRLIVITMSASFTGALSSCEA